MQKLNFCKLRLLHDIACKHDDAQMADFIGGTHRPQSERCGSSDSTELCQMLIAARHDFWVPALLCMRSERRGISVAEIDVLR